MFSGGLKKGDVIGIASPSHIATHEDYDPIFRAIEAMGLGWKAADHLFDADWGYANSDENRAADLNQLICDDQVKMIFFGGGEGGDEIIPLIDYQAAREHPKIWMGFSDGTSVLSAIRHRASLPATFWTKANTIADSLRRISFRGSPAVMKKAAPGARLCPGRPGACFPADIWRITPGFPTPDGFCRRRERSISWYWRSTGCSSGPSISATR